MKRLSTILMAALVVLAMSCKKNGNDDLAQGPGFRASMENQAGDSKTHLDGLDVEWDNGDAIMVVNVLGSAKEFTTNGEVTEGYADFQSDAPQSFYRPNFQAYYPWSIYNAQTRMVTLPETQDYKENSFEQGFNPMAARATDNTLEFKNLCGMLALQLTGECTVTSIRITAKGGEKLWGTGDVTMGGTDGGMEPTLGTLTGGTSTLTLNCGTGVTLSSTATTFYFVLPAGSLASGFDVLLTDSNNQVWTKSASTNTGINRSKIRVMPELSVEPRDPIVPEVTVTTGCVDCTYTVSGTVTVPTGSYTCEFGAVYSETDDTPTIEAGAQKIVAGTATFSGSQDFTIDITQMTEDVQYYIRTYAIVEGIAYSNDVRIVTCSTTKPLPREWTDNGGKNPHPFTVGSDKQVYFSQGNLQFRPAGATATAEPGHNVGGTWRFAEHQSDMLHTSNDDVSAEYVYTYDGWIDLFGWGSTGNAPTGDNHYVNYQPWATSKTNLDYDNNSYGYGPSTNSSNPDLSVSSGSDWGANDIINGGSNDWRTLTGGEDGEWYYLIHHRTDADKLYGQGRLGNCRNGLIILPDDWEWKGDVAEFEENWEPGVSAWSNSYSYSQWALMEAAGAIFLSAAGDRNGTALKVVNNYGLYWSSSYCEKGGAYYLDFFANTVKPEDLTTRIYGLSVRLVSDTPPTPTR